LTWFVVLWWNVTIRLWIVQFVFVWPHAEKTRKFKDKKNVTYRSIRNKEFLNDYLMTLSIRGKVLITLFKQLKEEVGELAMFNNKSFILSNISHWQLKKYNKTPIILQVAILLSNSLTHEHLEKFVQSFILRISSVFKSYLNFKLITPLIVNQV
jgi:hypothetical protein